MVGILFGFEIIIFYLGLIFLFFYLIGELCVESEIVMVLITLLGFFFFFGSIIFFSYICGLLGEYNHNKAIDHCIVIIALIPIIIILIKCIKFIIEVRNIKPDNHSSDYHYEDDPCRGCSGYQWSAGPGYPPGATQCDECDKKRR